MKIGVLTHSGTDDNYGQVLQCYALQTFLKKNNHSPFLIRYSSDNEIPKVRFVGIKNIMRNLLWLLSSSYRRKYNYYREISALRKLNITKNKARSFSAFLNENVSMTRQYISYEDLLNDSPEADAYIVGSDQVWNIGLLNTFSPAWYLQFGANNTRRIAYAASMGRNLNEEEIPIFKKFIAQLDGVSVRESSLLQQCHSLGLIQTKQVLDPTLLLSFSDYSLLFKDIPKYPTPYLFVYYINVDSVQELEWEQIKDYIETNGLQLRSVSSSGYLPAKDLIPKHENELLSIPEWLSALCYSECVVTTSFHGVVFSIIMHKPFVAVPLKNQYQSGNNRISSLLQSLNLQNRILNDNDISHIMDETIDWNDVDFRLNNMIQSSEAFLFEHLK